MRKTCVTLILLFLVIGCVPSPRPTVGVSTTQTQAVQDTIATMTAEAAFPTVTASPRPSLTPTPIVHVVQPGDTLWSIGALYGVTVDAICSFNKLADCDLISPGQELTIPIGEVPSTTPTMPPFPPPTPTSTPTSTSTLSPSPSPTVSPTRLGEQAHVVRVVDGDTIDVQIGSQILRVRYIGINTPETGQPCAAEATNYNAQLVMGKTVTLVKDVSETDRYGRLLRYVYVGDVFVNAELVRQGYANAATYPPDVAYADLFVQLEAEARTAGRGCWAVTPTPTSGTAWDCIGNIYNCSDFSSRAHVMSYWNACPGDPSWLDGDNDGIPCEVLCL